MKIAVLDDYFDTVRTLPSFALLAGHQVTVWTDHVQDESALAARLADVEALVLLRERTRITAGLIARLPKLRLISQRSVYPHIDSAACTAAGVIVSSNLHADTPSWAAAELTWALILASARQIPAQVASMCAGQWQSGVGRTLRGATLGIFGFGRIGAAVAGYGQAFGMKVIAWGSEGTRERAAAAGIAVADSKDALFAEATYCRSTCVSSPQRAASSARKTWRE